MQCQIRRAALGGALLALLHGGAHAQPSTVPPVVGPSDVAGMYFVAADGFETRVIHPQWRGDRLAVEDIRFHGNYPLIATKLPTDAAGIGSEHPATMVDGILTYVASGLFGGGHLCPQTVVFRRTHDPATAGIHAFITFDGPPESGPSMVHALTRTGTEWRSGQRPAAGLSDDFPG